MIGLRRRRRVPVICSPDALPPRIPGVIVIDLRPLVRNVKLAARRVHEVMVATGMDRALARYARRQEDLRYIRMLADHHRRMLTVLLDMRVDEMYERLGLERVR